MKTTHTTEENVTFEIPQGLSIRACASDSVACDDCRAWAWLDAGERIRHSSRCDTPDLQFKVSADEPSEPAPAEVMEECLECGSTFTSHDNVESGGMSCRVCAPESFGPRPVAAAPREVVSLAEDAVETLKEHEDSFRLWAKYGKTRIYIKRKLRSGWQECGYLSLALEGEQVVIDDTEMVRRRAGFREIVREALVSVGATC